MAGNRRIDPPPLPRRHGVFQWRRCRWRSVCLRPYVVYWVNGNSLFTIIWRSSPSFKYDPNKNAHILQVVGKCAIFVLQRLWKNSTVAKVMFSVVCLLFWPQCRVGVSCDHYPWCIGPHCEEIPCPMTHPPPPQTWDLTVQPPGPDLTSGYMTLL